MDNDLIITVRGRYTYDPERDCYHRIYAEQDQTHWSQFGWLYVIAVLAVTCWIII